MSPKCLRLIFIPFSSLIKKSFSSRKNYRRSPPQTLFIFPGKSEIFATPNGITLVEVLIAISLASLIMLPVILLFGVAEKVTYKSTNEIVATNLALQKIEELKSRPFNQLRSIIENNVPDPIDGPFVEAKLPREDNGIWNSPGVTYSREARLSFYPFVNPDVSAPDYELQKRRIRIRVIIYFVEVLLDGKKREKTFEMATLLGDETYNAGLNASFPLGLKP